jgi:hypothetical protein
MSYPKGSIGALKYFWLSGFLLLGSVLICFADVEARPGPTLQSQRDYILALSAVDHFLQAWQTGDAEHGMALLTAHAKRATTTEIVDVFFTGEAPSAYEIGHGKLLKRGRYEFPIVLMTSNNNHIHRRFSSIIVVDTGDNDWAIDKLP